MLCHIVAICSLGLSGNNFFVASAFHNTASYYNSTTKDLAYSRDNRPVEVVKKLGQSIPAVATEHWPDEVTDQGRGTVS